jgi:hypothetical protein
MWRCPESGDQRPAAGLYQSASAATEPHHHGAGVSRPLTSVAEIAKPTGDKAIEGTRYFAWVGVVVVGAPFAIGDRRWIGRPMFGVLLAAGVVGGFNGSRSERGWMPLHFASSRMLCQNCYEKAGHWRRS